MRVYGEWFWLINSWMDFLSLFLAAQWSGGRLRPAKAFLAAQLGALYALLAWQRGMTALRGMAALALAALLMSLIAFGGSGPRMFPLVMGAGWLLSGLADFLGKKGAPPAAVLWICGGACLLACVLLKRPPAAADLRYQLVIRLGKKQIQCDSLRDSGNQLRDGAAGLPVIVASEQVIRPLLAAPILPGDLSTLPPGWHFTRARTAAGEKTLMCFYPDAVWIRKGKKAWKASAAVAVSDFQEKRALLPEALFKGGFHDAGF